MPGMHESSQNQTHTTQNLTAR